MTWPAASYHWNESSNNVSEHGIDYELYRKYHQNRAVSDIAYWSLIVAYALLVIIGTIGNLLVILAVINNKGNFIFSQSHSALQM